MEKQPKFYFALFYLFILIHTLGSYLFYKGFLPNSGGRHHELEETSNADSVNKNNHGWPNEYNRLIFILIDAFRDDFVFGEKPRANFMPFLQNKIDESKTFSYVSVGNSPTVTMPRIKGVTSGTIPNFHDILMNAASTEFLEDNIISSFLGKGLKMTFFGDDTWLKLFPKHFIRSDGTQSFYVNDYTEVDDNVTRHLTQELNATDWDVMILHYLGLDHIGHTVGPFNPLIGRKLMEMDSIIRRIYKTTETFDSIHGTKSLLLITGDHGMSNAGSHGGSSREELNTPCIFLSSHNSGDMFQRTTIKQVDLAVTLAILFGVNIPRNSIGKPIPLIKKLYGTQDFNNISKHVACHLYDVAVEKIDVDILRPLKDVCNSIVNDDGEVDKVSQTLAALSSEYNGTYMVLALIIMLCSTALTSGLIFRSRQDIHLTFKEFNLIYPICAMTVSVVSLASSSLVEEEQYLYYYFVTSFFLGLYFKYRKYLSVVYIILVLVLLRILRGWNRTGVKWSGLEDAEDYLNQHTVMLLTMIYAGLLLVFLYCVICCQQSFSNLAAVLIITLSLLYFKTCSTGYLMPDWLYSKKLVLYSARIVYALSFILLIVGKLKRDKKSAKFSWIFLSLLLLKTTNFTWMCLLVLLEYIISTKIVPTLKLHQEMSTVTYFYLYYGLGKLSYFAQGNSNSFATVDISSGIIGLTEFDPLVSIAISYVGTYCANFLWYFSCKGSLQSSVVQNLGMCICMYQMFQLTFFCSIVYFMRYHLFIWSVFAPKYLYMVIESLVNVLIVFPLLYFL